MDIEFTGKNAQPLPKGRPPSVGPHRSKSGKEFYKISGIPEGRIPELGSAGVLFIAKSIGGIDLTPADAQSLAEGFSLRDMQKNGRDVYVVPRNVISKNRGCALMRIGVAFPIQKQGSAGILGYTCEGVKFFNNKEKNGMTPVLTPKACFELLDSGETVNADYTLELAQCKPSIWKNKKGEEFPQQEAMYRIKKKAVKQDQSFALRKAVNLGNYG